MVKISPHFLGNTAIVDICRKILSRKKRYVLMFHAVSKKLYLDLPVEIQPHFSTLGFEATLDWISKRYAFLTPTQFFNSREPGVLLTFDDGFGNNAVNVVPILEHFNAPAIFFITTQHIKDSRNWLPATRNLVKKYWPTPEMVPAHLAIDFYDGMTPEQVANCAINPLITIGAHTTSHPFLTTIPLPEQISELSESKEYLEKLCGQSVDYFAYPSGDYNDGVISAVKNVGYKAAFVIDTKKYGDPMYEIPRIGLYDADPGYLSLKLSGFHRPALKPFQM